MFAVEIPIRSRRRILTMQINWVCHSITSNEPIEKKLRTLGHSVIYSIDKIEDLLHAPAPDIWIIESQSDDIQAIEICKSIRSSQAQSGSYLVFQISEKVEEGLIQNAFHAGVDDLLISPVQWLALQIILSKAETYTKNKKYLARQFHRMNQFLKLATLSQLTRGISHELNNPLAIISGTSERIRSLSSSSEIEPSELAKFSEVIDRNVNRMRNTVKGILLLGRQEENPNQTFDLISIADTILLFLKTRYQAHKIQIKFDRPETAVRVYGRPEEIATVFFNLILNAFEAIAELEIKWIEIRVQETSEEWKISITDSGQVESNLRKQILTPYFSTKSDRFELGLGLSISKQMIQNHSGKLYLEDNSPHTCFIFTIPKNDPSNLKKG